MKIIQHYAQGGKHKANDIPCEDRTYSLSENGVTVIALADGAGGKRYTHAAVGAECVTKNISEFFCNNFDRFYEIEDKDEMKNVLVGVCHHHLKAAAEEVGVDEITKLSSTLLVVAVKDRKAIVCHIGDGVIGKVTTNSTRVVSAPDNGEFANHTFFISNPQAKEHLRIYRTKTDDVVAFFLMSDGTAEYVYDEDAARFHDSARKMSLMAGEENGEEKLAETIEKYMIGPDPTSDDCSFIAMLYDEKVKSLDVGLSAKVYESEEKTEPKINYEGEFTQESAANYENEASKEVNLNNAVKSVDVNNFMPVNNARQYAETNRSKDVQRFKIISAVLSVFIVAVMVVIVVLGIKIAKNKDGSDSSKDDKKATVVFEEKTTKKPEKETSGKVEKPTFKDETDTDKDSQLAELPLPPTLQIPDTSTQPNTPTQPDVVQEDLDQRDEDT